MNSKENKKQLKQTMAMLKIKIENLKPHIEESDRLNSLYNKMLVEKAIVKKELDSIDAKKVGLIEKFANLFRQKDKKLISDYFHS